MAEFQGRIGIGDGWKLVFAEPFVDDPVVGDDVLTFSNDRLLVMPTVVPVTDAVTDQWLVDWSLAASAKAVADGLADQDLGRIDGSGWTGSLAAQQLPDGQEYKLMGYLTAPRAALHLTVRFRELSDGPAARLLIGAVEHDAAGAQEMNQVLNDARAAQDQTGAGH